MKSKKIKKINMVIGNPIKQSKSPVLHGQIYKSLKLDAITIPVSDSDVGKLVSKIRTESVGLTAVTMPFKKSVIPMLDNIDKTAKSVNAVNTIINKNGKLSGYNTDVDGVRYALRDVPITNKKVLLLGGGGAGHAAAYVIRENKGKLIYLNRNAEESVQMKKKFKGEVAAVEKLSAGDIDVIINATPAGMFPDLSGMAVPPNLIGRHQTVFDVVYNPIETKFLKIAKKKGASVISGIDMFVAQGIRQIELWTNKKIISPNLVSRLKKVIIAKLKI